jgi:cyclopropane-fatty-acyl-phospholipid synthase
MVITKTASAVASYAGSFAWPPLLSLSRGAVLNLLRNVQIGSLTITDTDGTISICGSPQRVGDLTDEPSEKNVYTVPHCELRVLNDLFWVRLLLFADMGFAESYMMGEVECPDLTAFFKLFIVNRKYLSNGSTLSSTLFSRISGLVRKTNTLTTAKLNISAHYDISNDMFAAFLSPDMTYSCPIWLPKSDPMCKEETLEQAQYRKLNRFIRNCRIKKNDHVLEIGTGWGSFAMLAVEKTGCRVTSLTLSEEQKKLAEEKIRAAGFSDHIRVLLCDYRSLPVPQESEKYDKVVSIEMLEAVGAEYLETYFRCVDRLLKTDGGVACFQCITIPESRYAGYKDGDDFIRRYIFPGGHLPTVTQLLDAIRAGSRDGVEPRLIPESVENIGPHYAKTLRLWRQNFMQTFATTIKPALVREFMERERKKMTEEEVEVFRKKWEYYFAYCEAGFATKTLGDVIITVGREGAVEMMDDVPL